MMTCRTFVFVFLLDSYSCCILLIVGLPGWADLEDIFPGPSCYPWLNYLQTIQALFLLSARFLQVVLIVSSEFNGLSVHIMIDDVHGSMFECDVDDVHVSMFEFHVFHFCTASYMKPTFCTSSARICCNPFS